MRLPLWLQRRLLVFHCAVRQAARDIFEAVVGDAAAGDLECGEWAATELFSGHRRSQGGSKKGPAM